MKLIPFIVLNGQAEEAIKYYVEILAGEIKWIGRYVDCMPDTAESHKQLIIHSEIEFRGNTICICDAPEGTVADLGKNGYSLNLMFDTTEEVTRVYELMKEQSEIRCELGETFFAEAYAELTDRFGVSWNLLVEKKD